MWHVTEVIRPWAEVTAQTQLWIGAVLGVAAVCVWAGLGTTTALVHRSGPAGAMADGCPASAPVEVRPGRVTAAWWALCARQLTTLAVIAALMGGLTYTAVDTGFFKNGICVCTIGASQGWQR
ncbi:hypothetical protein [Mycobacterium servetii]|uniref:Transmembrane protein n=1 Tax=Mycobacterium servetii TaxID=3237418 RepID=A0ABV4C9V0_9MYCO